MAEEIARQFVTFYYQAFDSDRKSLASLYRDQSTLTWESKSIVGGRKVIEHLTELPFQTVAHKVTTLDAQPSNPEVPSIIVLVTGLLVVDGSENPLQFSQCFHLIPEGGSYYVLNDVFRLNYG